MRLTKIVYAFVFSLLTPTLSQADQIMQYIPSSGWQPSTLLSSMLDSLMISSGPAGWYLGYSIGSPILGVNSGDGKWREFYIHLSARQPSFTPNQPETGNSTSGWAWAKNNNQMAYFNGNGFNAPISSPINTIFNVYASQGISWAIGTTMQISTSSNNTWSQASVPPFIYNDAKLSSIAASGGSLYVLGLNADQSSYALFSVDRQNNIKPIQLPALPQGSPVYETNSISARVLANGSNVFVFLPTFSNDGQNLNEYAILSQDGGQSWIDVSLNLPLAGTYLDLPNLINHMTLVNNRVIIDPFLKANGIWSNGAYLNISNAPQWQMIAPPPGIVPNYAYSVSSVSFDGQQQCIYQSPQNVSPVVSCFDFAQNRWLISVASVPPNFYVKHFEDLIPLGNSKLVAIGISNNGRPTRLMYINGTWNQYYVSNGFTLSFGSMVGPTYNNNNIWAYGSFLSASK